MKTLLLTGATGSIGGEVLRCLSGQNHSLRALVRDVSKAQNLAPHAQLVAGDFADISSLEKALSGVDAAFLVSANTPDQRDLELNFVRAAHASGVRRLVKLSVMAAGAIPDSPFQVLHREVEREIEDLGFDFTHLRPNMLMQNMRWFLPTMRESGAFFHILGDTPVSHADARDVAEVAARCLTENGHENRAYTLTGAEALNFSQVAALFSQALEKPVQYVDVSAAQMKAARAANGEPEPYLDAEIALFQAWNRGFGSEITDEMPRILGRNATTFAQFVPEFVAKNR